MTRLAMSLLPTFGYFSLLLLAGYALLLELPALEHLCSNGLGSRRSCISNQYLIPLFPRIPLDTCHGPRKDSLVDQIIRLLSIDLNPTWHRCLPMSREYYNSLRPNLGRDLFSNLLQLAVDGMIYIVHDVRLSPINQRPYTAKTSSFHTGQLTPP